MKQRARALPLPTALALGWLALLAAVALLAPWLPLPYGPADPDLLHLAVPPGWRGPAPHYLGTDPLGRDLLAGLVFGARRLLLITLPATALAAVVGALLGSAAGYWGNSGLRLPLWVGLLALLAGWWVLRLPALVGLGAALGLVVLAARARWQLPLPLDRLVMGLTVLLGAVPRLVLVLALSAGPPLAGGWLLGLLALLAWPDIARLVRTQMLQVRVLPFVEAARALGLPPGRVWWHHALPAACRPLRAFVPLTLAALIALENTLAFLGIGESLTTSSWGQLLSELRQAPGDWWLLLAPGGALLVTLLALQQLAQYRPR